jgi:hypothetical protein
VGGGHAQQDHLFTQNVGADGHLFLPLAQGFQKGLGIGDLQLGAVEHLQGAVLGAKARVLEVPGPGLDGQLLLKRRVGVDVLGGHSARQRFQLVHLQADDTLKVSGDLLAHAGHVQGAHLVDGVGALVAHVDAEEREHADTEQGDHDQAGDEKPGRSIFHPPAPS